MVLPMLKKEREKMCLVQQRNWIQTIFDIEK